MRSHIWNSIAISVLVIVVGVGLDYVGRRSSEEPALSQPAEPPVAGAQTAPRALVLEPAWRAPLPQNDEDVSANDGWTPPGELSFDDDTGGWMWLEPVTS